MEKVFRVETSLAHELAELYAALLEEFETKSSIPLADMNRTLLQTGLIHHLTMMSRLGLIDGEKTARIDALVDRVARNTIMWDLLKMVRSYWQDCADGKIGGIDFKA